MTLFFNRHLNSTLAQTSDEGSTILSAPTTSNPPIIDSRATDHIKCTPKVVLNSKPERKNLANGSLNLLWVSYSHTRIQMAEALANQGVDREMTFAASV